MTSSGPVEAVAVQAPQRVDDVVGRAVRFRRPDELVARRGVVDAAEVLLDLDRMDFHGSSSRRSRRPYPGRPVSHARPDVLAWPVGAWGGRGGHGPVAGTGTWPYGSAGANEDPRQGAPQLELGASAAGEPVTGAGA